MKIFFNTLLIIIMTLNFIGCQQENPLIKDFDTPFGMPPFEKIKVEHFMPAIKEGINQHKAEIDAIINNSEAPTFDNTIVALERAGSLLNRVNMIFGNLNAALTNDEMQNVAVESSPILSAHGDDISMNAKLFERIKAVYDMKETLGLNPEETMLLEKTYKGFVRSGANLNEEDKSRLRKVNEELALLSLKFGENVLKETNKFELVIENEEDLNGLPEGVIAAASETATARGHEGKWVFTVSKPSMLPFLAYSSKRELREKIYKAYTNQGNNNDELDNKETLLKIVKLRIERAHLLGYESHAAFTLENRMAKTPEAVFNLLDMIWDPALKVAKKEMMEMQAIIDQEGGGFKLAAWDWWYYAEKVKKIKYDFDEEEVRPYLKLENVINGVFEVATKLWGLKFEERTDLPKYHPDVKVFEIKDANDEHLAILLTDYFPRDSKRGGAWMDNFSGQYIVDGKNVRPVIYNCGNFTKPTADMPSLINIDEALTLFHEFGHALHGMLSNVTYESLSGANVQWDFVELPSQIMENWAMKPEVLKSYALHYETGEPIPDSLIEKMDNAGKFNQGFGTVEFIAAAYLDMAWHTLKEGNVEDALAFENGVAEKLGLIPEIAFRYRSTYYNHIFSGGYSSGYYSYIWAEVLDKDAFEAFTENGLFDQATATSFRKNILERGGTEDGMTLYKRFRGREPRVEPLLKGRGLL
ncbi:MAG: M3 family metallopeptidase [Bacteroidetes bacterium]|nr:M3 family metallopeptidase [Bacteroidota bacterium]